MALCWLPSGCQVVVRGGDVVWHRSATKLMIVMKAKVFIVMKFMYVNDDNAASVLFVSKFMYNKHTTYNTQNLTVS